MDCDAPLCQKRLNLNSANDLQEFTASWITVTFRSASNHFCSEDCFTNFNDEIPEDKDDRLAKQAGDALRRTLFKPPNA